MPNEDSEIEIRPIFEPEDFGPEFTTEMREYEARLGEKMARNARK